MDTLFIIVLVLWLAIYIFYRQFSRLRKKFILLEQDYEMNLIQLTFNLSERAKEINALKQELDAWKAGK